MFSIIIIIIKNNKKKHLKVFLDILGFCSYSSNTGALSNCEVWIWDRDSYSDYHQFFFWVIEDE